MPVVRCNKNVLHNHVLKEFITNNICYTPFPQILVKTASLLSEEEEEEEEFMQFTKIPFFISYLNLKLSLEQP